MTLSLSLPNSSLDPIFLLNLPLSQAELDLKRLRDPLQLHLPIQQISTSKD